MNPLSTLVYELRPYLYAGISGFALTHSHHSKVIIISGIVLAVCSAVDFKMRIDYRRAAKKDRLKFEAEYLNKSYARYELPKAATSRPRTFQPASRPR